MQNNTQKPILTPEAVELFLKKHSDFFVHRPDLFAKLALPQEAEHSNVASITGFQARRLQMQVDKLEDKNRKLIQTSIQNMESQNQIHNLALQILGADSWQHMLDVLDTTMRTTMDVESVTLCLLDTLDIKGANGTTTASARQIEGLFKDNATVCLRTLCADDMRTMHAAKAAEMQSDALIRLHLSDGTPVGMLALGSTRRDRFHAGQGGDLLSFLGGLMGTVLSRWTEGAAQQQRAV